MVECMAKLILLGSSNAIADKAHENTYMVLVGEKHTVLIDCVNNPLLRLQDVGVDFNSLTDLILTHFHPDHVSGVPLLLMNMWLMGRRAPLNIYGLHHTLDRVESMMASYEWGSWPDFFPISFCRLPMHELTTVMDVDEFKILASPVHHMIPAIGLRVEFKPQQKALAYSCDTEPCQEVVHLAEGVDVLIHEAAGAFLGHSSAAQAAEDARQAEVGELILIHYPTGRFASGDLVAEARERFSGPVRLAADFMVIEF